MPCCALAALPGRLLALEVACSSILEPHLRSQRLEFKNSVVYRQMNDGRNDALWRACNVSTYLNCRFRKPSDGCKRLLRFNVRVLCGVKGPLQLAQLRLAESCALPAALGVRARPDGSMWVSCWHTSKMEQTVIRCMAK